MKTQTLLIIIAACLAIIAFAGLFIYGIASEKGNEKGINFGKKLSESMVIICSYIVFVSLNNTGKSFSDSFYTQRRFSEMHNLPQLDSTMMYMTGTTRRTYYLSWSKDSILHHSKEIEYDITDVYSVTDCFINKKDELILESIFIKQNMLRDSANIYILSKWSDYPSKNADTITRKDFDKLIEEWGLANKIYKRFNMY